MTTREEEQYNQFVNEKTKESVIDEMAEYRSKIFDELAQIKKENEKEINEHFKRLGFE